MTVPSRDDSQPPGDFRPPRQPVFNAPPAVLCLAGLIALAYAGEQFLVPVRAILVPAGALVTGGAADWESPLGAWSPWLLHVFLHGGLLHLTLNVFALTGFGAAAARPFGPGLMGAFGFTAFFFACAALGAAGHALTHLNEPTVMVGASTAISGCVAAAGWAMGGWRGMANLALPWAGINVLLAILNMNIPIPISWAGHLGGLAGGVLLYPLFIVLFRRR
ncbi:MAG: rhomboid family intramembrane serine protease [Maricaulaceae bacterium]|nr:rhomboid family intramembrane serine protease [Maricaulaceae bacterium]